jgi:carbon storage regulator
MLVLSRHAGQKIKIGDNITITVCEIRPDKVRIGIEAPRDVTVNRAEVLERERPMPLTLHEDGTFERMDEPVAPPEPHE